MTTPTDPARPQPASDSNAFLDAVAADPKLAAEISAAVDATFAAAHAGNQDQP
jgi:hypothetical protein